jgi:hypothetical protein
MADDTNKGPLPGLGGAPATPARPADQKPVDTPKPADAPKADDKPSGGVNVVIERDYWPKDQPKQEDGALGVRENRVRAGETVNLPSDEAMDVIEAGIGKRAKGG